MAARIFVRVHLFFCTYSTSIHISRQLYFSFLSVRLFFPIVGCPTFLFCSFSLVPFPFSLLPSHYYPHRESIKEFVCFPFVFGPNFFFFFFFSLFSICLLSLALMYLQTPNARTHTEKKRLRVKKTNTHTQWKKKRVVFSLNTILLFFLLFFNLRAR